MLRSIAARGEHICFHKTAALRCVSKHEAAIRAAPSFETLVDALKARSSG
jgi:hypothetical protein